jgi:predicted house-cleaning noncanonical NTP pyrophosphatase (MazG superfamily)
MYKLIRDNMPNIIKCADPEAVTTMIRDVYPENHKEKYLSYLMDKLHEETEELLCELRKPEISRINVDEEACDVLEVLKVISRLYGEDDFDYINQRKERIRGSFYKGYLLDTATGKNPAGG